MAWFCFGLLFGVLLTIAFAGAGVWALTHGNRLAAAHVLHAIAVTLAKSKPKRESEAQPGTERLPEVPAPARMQVPFLPPKPPVPPIDGDGKPEKRV